MVYLESIAGAVTAPVAPPEVDERAARRALRAQIARLERDLAAAVISAYPRLPVGRAGVPASGPRLLGLGELERVRDDLAGRLADMRGQIARQGERQEVERVLIERMLLEPGAYRWVRSATPTSASPAARPGTWCPASASSACSPAGGT